MNTKDLSINITTATEEEILNFYNVVKEDLRFRLSRDFNMKFTDIEWENYVNNLNKNDTI